MLSKNWKLLLVFALLLSLALAACGGGTVEETAEEAAAVIEEAAETVQESANEIAETVENVAEEVEQAAEEMMDDGPCAPSTEGALAGVDPRNQAIQWWHNHTGSREEQLLELIADYNETNECGITVEALNQGDYNDIRDAVNASVAAGEVPATLVVGYQNDQAFYQLNETLVDLNEYVNDPAWGLTNDERADFYASFFDQSIHTAYNDQRLGFPPNRSIEMLHYNKSYLTDLGYDAPPATPEEFKEMACAAAAASESGTGGFVLRESASAVAAWTFAFGGDILSEDGTEYIYDGEATIEAMKFLQELATEGEDGLICAYFFDGFANPELASRNALFAMGSSSGMPFYVSDFQTIAEEQGLEPDEYAVAAIPHTTPDPVMNIYGGDVMIVKTTPEQQLAAWLFTKWFTSPEQQARWVEISNYFPTRAGTTDFLGDYVEANPQFGTAIDLLQYGKFEPQLISYQSVRDAAEEAATAIFQGADVESTLQELTEQANEFQAELLEEQGG